MKFAVIVFPGSNCDRDMYHAVKHVLGMEADLVWYENSNLENYDAILLPGGFSYGDYLRSGAIASASNVMQRSEERRVGKEWRSRRAEEKWTRKKKTQCT